MKGRKKWGRKRIVKDLGPAHSTEGNKSCSNDHGVTVLPFTVVTKPTIPEDLTTVTKATWAEPKPNQELSSYNSVFRMLCESGNYTCSE